MVEIWDLYNRNKQKVGLTHERGKEQLIPKGLYHLVVEVWTLNLSGEILVAKRHPSKPFGLMWECTGALY